MDDRERNEMLPIPEGRFYASLFGSLSYSSYKVDACCAWLRVMEGAYRVH